MRAVSMSFRPYLLNKSTHLETIYFVCFDQETYVINDNIQRQHIEKS